MLERFEWHSRQVKRTSLRFSMYGFTELCGDVAGRAAVEMYRRVLVGEGPAQFAVAPEAARLVGRVSLAANRRSRDCTVMPPCGLWQSTQLIRFLPSLCPIGWLNCAQLLPWQEVQLSASRFGSPWMEWQEVQATVSRAWLPLSRPDGRGSVQMAGEAAGIGGARRLLRRIENIFRVGGFGVDGTRTMASLAGLPFHFFHLPPAVLITFVPVLFWKAL